MLLIKRRLQLSVIIVSFNVKYFLEQCLCAVKKAISNIQAEVWVVDNASTDGSIEYLKGKFPFVAFVENKINTGFAKANNLALRKAAGKYVLFLNPDTIVPEDCFEKCLAFAESNRHTGAVGVRMIDGSGTFLPESKRSFPAPGTSFFKLIGLNSLFPKSTLFGRYSLGFLSEHENHEVDVLSGAFMLAQRQLLLQLGGFDETFFMYGEDIDLSYRIQQSGYRNYYFAATTIIHFKGESTKKGSLDYVRMFYSAMNIFVTKHYSGIKAKALSRVIQSATALQTFAIKAKRFFSITMQQSKQVNGNKNAVNKNMIVIVGTQKDFEFVKRSLIKANILSHNIHHVSVQEITNTENRQSIISEIHRITCHEIIFCEGSLSFAEIIYLLQKLGTKSLIRFYARDSGSIISSCSKINAGEFIIASG